jgi:hypothetical protein
MKKNGPNDEMLDLEIRNVLSFARESRGRAAVVVPTVFEVSLEIHNHSCVSKVFQETKRRETKREGEHK